MKTYGLVVKPKKATPKKDAAEKATPKKDAAPPADTSQDK